MTQSAASILGRTLTGLHVQFEDPTETLQALRDLVDLQRAMDCEWLQAAAEQVR